MDGKRNGVRLILKEEFTKDILEREVRYGNESEVVG